MLPSVCFPHGASGEPKNPGDDGHMPISRPPRARPTVRPAGASWAPWLGQLRPIRAYSPSLHHTRLSPLVNTRNVRCLPPLAVACDHYKALAITKHIRLYDLMHYDHFFFSSRNERELRNEARDATVKSREDLRPSAGQRCRAIPRPMAERTRKTGHWPANPAL